MVTKKAAAKRAIASRAGAKRGPKSDVLKIHGEWEDAVKKSLSKKKPLGGWPKDKP